MRKLPIHPLLLLASLSIFGCASTPTVAPLSLSGGETAGEDLQSTTATAMDPRDAPAAASRAEATPIPEKPSPEPGDFEWDPQRSRRGPVMVMISLRQQMAYVYRNGVLIGRSTVSTGRPGYKTPTGRFEILQKKVDHVSNLYEGAQMPFMQRLTWDGIALHGGDLPGYPASHGCIRLPMAFAQLLYGSTRLGTPVIITDDDHNTAPPLPTSS